MEKIYSKLEIRELSQDGSLLVTCKVNDYSLSKTLRGINGEFKEQIPKEVWQRAIEQNKENIKVFYNHQDIIDIADKVEFRIEDDGVYADVVLSDKAQGLYEKIKNGLCTGMSFGFKALKQKFENVGNFVKRTIESMELFEVSILDKEPAYYNTSVECRSIEIPNTYNFIEIEKMRLELMKVR